MVAASQEFPIGGCAEFYPEGGGSGAGEFNGALSGVKVVPFGSGAVHGEQRCCFGEPVNLDEFPIQFGFYSFNDTGGRWGPGHHDAHSCGTRDRPVPVGGGF